MQAKQSWFGKQAFGKDTNDLVTVSYKSHQDALLFLQSVLNERTSVALLQGPQGSGKSTIARRLEELLPGGSAVAFIDGTNLHAHEMLSEMLGQFGYEADLDSDDELENMLKVFALQQTRSSEPPVVIIDNVDRMHPDALRTLNALAELEEQERFALRIILTGREGLSVMVDAEGMPAVKRRVTGSYSIHPLTPKETLIYLHARLEACGVNNANTVFPVDVCDRLHLLSGGWPGVLNESAMDTIGRATNFPLKLSDTMALNKLDLEPASDLPVLPTSGAGRPSPPGITVTKDKSVVSEYTFRQSKVLIGRSDFADVVIDDHFVSKMHAVMLLYSDALVLIDLNSANGTTVNSVRVRSTILRSDDIISLGDHRLKITNAPAISDEMAKLLANPDTIKMKSLMDIRRKRAQRLALVTTTGAKPG